MTVHTTIDGWTRDELVAALSYWRGRGDDIKRVWRSGRRDEQQQKMTGEWEYAVSKTRLAEALWGRPCETRSTAAGSDADAPVPEIVEVVQDRLHLLPSGGGTAPLCCARSRLRPPA